MSDEIELKLEVAPEAAKALMTDSPWLTTSDSRSEHQQSVYYDTPDLKLRKSGYVLRVRSIESRFVQTLKSLDGGAGLFDRGEWEWDIDGSQPDLARLVGTPVGELEIAELKPVIRSEIDRTICRVDQCGSELEFDLDLGTMSANSRDIPVSEVEVELIRGKPRAAVELAQRISAEIPVKLAVMSKAERGFALADGSLFGPTKAEAVKLARGMNVAEGFETVVFACLRHFRLNEPLVIESRHIEGLHQARVAMRRLRSAFALFRPVVHDQECERIEDELRWFAAELGDARNLDVYLERDLSEDQRRFVEERRERAYDLAIAAMESTRFRRLMLDLSGWAATGDWRAKSRAAKPLERFVDRRIDRLWAKIANPGAVADMGDKRRHRLRIAMKKLRYALEFTEALHLRRARRRKKFAKSLKGLQESLGQLHDAVVCRSLVTLNSWIMAPNPSAMGERRLVRDADRAMRRLRRIGPYW
jgi:inorganic triphosphatase YgiF